MWITRLVALCGALLVPAVAHAGQGLDLRGWLDRPGVKLLAVEFYATWCGPCMEAVPRWKALHEKYRKEGLRLVVVATQDPEAGCVNPGWNPDDVICDDDGTLARMMGADQRLPAAFLWSWQGNLLVKSGHVGEVEERIEEWMRKSPRVEVDVKKVGKGVRVASDSLNDMLRSEIQRTNKLVVVATEEERKRLRALKKKALGSGYDDKTACEIGKELSPNSLLDARVSGGRRQRLRLSLLSAERGCLVAGSLVDWNSRNPEIAVAEAVTELVQKLRPSIQMPRGRMTSVTRNPGLRPRGRDEVIGDEVTEWEPESGPERVIVDFASEPSGAVVLLDGQLLCQNTAKGCRKIVSKGVHVVEMQKERYFKKSERITVEGATEVSLELKPNFGWIGVTSEPAGLEVKVDGKVVGTTPLADFEADPGRHEVLVSDPCFYDRGKRVSIRAGDKKSVDVKLKARYGAIDVKAFDGKKNAVPAEIFVDGEPKGRVPRVVKVSVCAKQVELRRDGKVLFSSALSVQERKTTPVDAIIDTGPTAESRGQVALYANTSDVDYRPDKKNSEGAGLEKTLQGQGRKVSTFTSMRGRAVARALSGQGAVFFPDMEKGSPSMDSAGERALRDFVKGGGVVSVVLDDPAKQRSVKMLNEVFGWRLDAGVSTGGTSTLQSTPARELGLTGLPSSLPANDDTDALKRASLPDGTHRLYANKDGEPTVALVPYGRGFALILGWDWFGSKPKGSKDGGWHDVLNRVLGLGAIRPSSEDHGRSSGGGGAGIAFYTNTSHVDYNPSSKTSEGGGLKAGLEDMGHRVSTFTSMSGVGGALSGKAAFVIPELEKGAPSLSSSAKSSIRSFVDGGGTMVVVLDERAKERSSKLLNSVFGWSLRANKAASGKGKKQSGAAASVGFSGPSSVGKNDDTDVLLKTSLPSGAHTLYADDLGHSMVTLVPRGSGLVAIMGWDWYDAKPRGKLDGGWLDVLRSVLQLRGVRPSSGSAPAVSGGAGDGVALYTNTTYVDYRTSSKDSEGAGMKRTLEKLGYPVSTFTSLTSSSLRSTIAGKRAVVFPDMEKKGPVVASSSKGVLRDFVEGGGHLVVVCDERTKLNSTKMLNSIFGWRLKADKEAKGTSYEQSGAARSLGYSGPSSLPKQSSTDVVLSSSLPSGAKILYKDGDGHATITVIPRGRGYVTVLGWDWYDSKPKGKKDGGWHQALQGVLRIGGGAPSGAVAGRVSGLRPHTNSRALLYTNTAHVDYNTSQKNSEGDGMKRTLEGFGYRVRTFTSVDAGRFQRAVRRAKASAVVFPDMEKSGPSLSGSDARALKDFVEGGGRLFVVLDERTKLNSTKMINAAFGWNLKADKEAAGDGKKQSAVASALGFDGPYTVKKQSSTDVVKKSSLPSGARVLYADSKGDAVVTVLPVGRGFVAVLGWDWYDSKPRGKKDGGWHRALKGLLKMSP